jgi:hypothetical protein
MNLQEQVSRINDMMEQMSGKYNKPTSEIEKLVYRLLNRYTEGSDVYHITHYSTRTDLEWCKDGREIMTFVLFFTNLSFENGTLTIPEDKFNDILDIVPIRATYLSHLILQWFEDTKLSDAKNMIGRDDIDVDKLDVLHDTADVCAPPPTKPDNVTKDEMIDYIIVNTLFKKEELKKKSDEWIEKMYLGKLRNQKEKELRGE